MKNEHFSIKGAANIRAHSKLDREKHKILDKRKYRLQYRRTEKSSSTTLNKSSNKIQVHSLVRKLSLPGCNIISELNKIKAQHPTFFVDAGRVITSILSQLGKNIDVHDNHTKYVAYTFWEWVTSQESKTKLNNYHFNSFLSICAKCHDWKRAIQVLNVEMKNAGIKKDEFSYTSAINACAYNCDKGIELFNQMRDEGIKPRNEVLYNTVISACSTGFNIDGAIDAFSKMKKDGISPSVRTYSSLITCCEKCREWELALEYLNEMKESGFTNCPYSYSAAIGACGNCGQWEKALELLRELDSDKATEVVYCTTIVALENCLQWEKALDLFEEMKSKNECLTVVSYGAAISACGKGYQYLQCLDYLDELTNNHIQKNCVIYGAAISCMDKCFRCDIIFKLLEQMKVENIKPTSSVYNTIMAACAKCQLWKEGFSIFSKMCDLGLEKELITYNIVLDLTCPYDMSKAREIFKQGIELGFYARMFKSNETNSYFEIDLHFCSVGSSIIALLWWFDEYVIPHFTKTAKPKLKTIHIITGYGKSRMENIVKKENTHGKQGIAKHVHQVLKLLKLKEIPQNNVGLVKLCTETFQKVLGKNNGKITLNAKAYMEYVVDELNTTAANIRNVQQVRRGFVQQVINESVPAKTSFKKEMNTSTSTEKMSKKKKKDKKKEKDSSPNEKEHATTIIPKMDKENSSSEKVEKKKKKRKHQIAQSLESKFDSMMDEDNEFIDIKPKKKRKSDKKSKKKK